MNACDKCKNMHIKKTPPRPSKPKKEDKNKGKYEKKA